MQDEVTTLRPLPRPTRLTQPFWDGLRQRKVMIQYSPSTDRWVFYPRRLAPGTLAGDLEWREIPGTGHLYTFTVARKPTAHPWRDVLPQLLAIVELDEGPRLTTELVNIDPIDIRVGVRLRPVFYDVPRTTTTLLYYAPLSE